MVHSFHKEDPWNIDKQIFWLMVEPTHLKKYARQIGSFPQVGVKITNIRNHHLDIEYVGSTPQPVRVANEGLGWDSRA